MSYVVSNNDSGNNSQPQQYDSMQSIAKPSSSPNIEDALLSASHNYYDGASNKGVTSSSSISGFSTERVSKLHKTSRRKSSFWTQPSATVFSSTMNLCNTVIGAGILGLPETMTHTGWLLGFVLLILFAILAQITLHLAMISSHSLKIKENNIRVSYLIMCSYTIPKFKYLVDFSVGITCFGVCCAYLVVIGDLMPDVASQIIDRSHIDESTLIEDILESRQLWIIIFLIIFIIPTTRLKKMDALRFTSTAAIICFGYVTIIVVLFAFIPELELCDKDDPIRYEEFCIHKGEISAIPIVSSTDLLKFFKAAPIIIFAYTCHQNSFSVINELEIASKTNLNKVVIGSETICCCIYMIVAFCGYRSFGESAPSNLLTAYPKTIPILIVRICLSLAIAFSYPVLAHPARNSFSSLIFNVTDSNQLNWFKYNCITWLIVLFSFIISIITDDLGIVLSIVGSTGTTIIAFILPSLFYYYLPNNILLLNQSKNTIKKKKILALTMLIFGLIMIPFNITMIFVD